MTDESSGTRPVVMERLKICQRGNAVEETVDFSIRRRYHQVSFGRETLDEEECHSQSIGEGQNWQGWQNHGTTIMYTKVAVSCHCGSPSTLPHVHGMQCMQAWCVQL